MLVGHAPSSLNHAKSQSRGMAKAVAGALERSPFLRSTPSFARRQK
ncbi:hypothetical protein HMPREF9946_03397 [Acetobacteraceae bacterium AT-5844]|nr:hypothetical protein HMPREF9946_03397 [Acetobacteraceae bacterium AT-5844]